MKKQGFTMIELLVAMAVITVVAVILFPVFTQARVKANAITCLSNLKHIGIAQMQYVQDNDQTYFPANYGITTASGMVEIRWYDMVNRYVGSGGISRNGHKYGQGDIWHCPSFPSHQDAEYGVHEFMFPGWTGSVEPGQVLAGPVTTLAELDTPANTITTLEKGQNDGNSSWPYFNAEQSDWTGGVGNPPGSYANPNHYDVNDKNAFDTNHHNCDLAYSPATPAWNEYGSCSTMPRYRHQNACNVLFADGHAKAIKAGRIEWATNIYIPEVWAATGKIVDTGTGAGPG